jgi:hypothetical protein
MMVVSKLSERTTPLKSGEVSSHHAGNLKGLLLSFRPSPVKRDAGRDPEVIAIILYFGFSFDVAPFGPSSWPRAGW